MEKLEITVSNAPLQKGFKSHTRFHISLLLSLALLSWVLCSRIATEEIPDRRNTQIDINRVPPVPKEEFAWTQVKTFPSYLDQI